MRHGMELAPLLRCYRLGRGMTQAEIGSLVGLGASGWAHLETGRRSLRPRVARRLFALIAGEQASGTRGRS